jgi:hypothetical protein
MQSYAIDQELIREDSPQWGQKLKWAYTNKQRPLCMCVGNKPGVPVYVVQFNQQWFLKRMPFTGSLHAATCDHYEPPSELSGYGQVAGSAIRDDANTQSTNLALDFPLTQGAARNKAVQTGIEHDSARADGTKLTLRATLHYLFDQAQLTRWSPKMVNKRTWAVVRRELLAAAAGKSTKGLPLGEVLFIPETFSSADLDGVANRRASALERLSRAPTNRMLLIAELKTIEPARFGFKMMFKHLPNMPVALDDDLYKRLVARFHAQVEIWQLLESSHLLVVATFAQPQPGLFRLESACFVNVNEHWLPFDGMHEYELLAKLVQSQRYFTKGLRYNMDKTKPLACAVLQDTPSPVAMFIVPADSTAGYETALAELIAQSGMETWSWYTKDVTIPALPGSLHHEISGRPRA